MDRLGDEQDPRELGRLDDRERDRDDEPTEAPLQDRVPDDVEPDELSRLRERARAAKRDRRYAQRGGGGGEEAA